MIPDRCYRIFKNDFDTGFLAAGFIQKKKKIEIDQESYSHYALVKVLSGKGRFIDENGKTYPLKTGSIFQRLPGIRHSLYIDSNDWTEAFIAMQHVPIKNNSDLLKPIEQRNRQSFISEFFESECRTVDLLTRFSVINPNLRVWESKNEERTTALFREILRKIHEFDDFEIDSLQGLFLKLITELTSMEKQTKKQRAVWLEDSLRLLRSKIESRAKVPEILATIPMSYPHLRAEFKKEMVISPGHYRIKVRIEEACLLLTRDGLNVQEVAARLNYKDPFAFSAQFKKVMGLSPKRFRVNK